MSNFTKISPVDIALAMAAPDPSFAVHLLCKAAGHPASTCSIDCTDETWSATGLPVRHGLLMEWLAAECAA